MTKEQLSKLFKSDIRWWTTKNGTPIVPYVSNSPALDPRKTEGGRRYRLCQILPAIPQRFEWINVDNIQEHRA